MSEVAAAHASDLNVYTPLVPRTRLLPEEQGHVSSVCAPVAALAEDVGSGSGIISNSRRWRRSLTSVRMTSGTASATAWPPTSHSTGWHK